MVRLNVPLNREVEGKPVKPVQAPLDLDALPGPKEWRACGQPRAGGPSRSEAGAGVFAFGS